MSECEFGLQKVLFSFKKMAPKHKDAVSILVIGIMTENDAKAVSVWGSVLYVFFCMRIKNEAQSDGE